MSAPSRHVMLCPSARQQPCPPISPADLDLVGAWCVKRVPMHARDQVAIGYTKRGAAITLLERRAPWDGVGDWTSPVRPTAAHRLGLASVLARPEYPLVSA